MPYPMISHDIPRRSCPTAPLPLQQAFYNPWFTLSRIMPEGQDGDVHPLQHTWAFFCSSAKDKNKKNWNNVNKEITKMNSVEDFWSLYDVIPQIRDTAAGNDFYFFKEFSTPSWEHPSNKDGGFWSIDASLHDQAEDLQEMWLNFILRIIGNTYPHADLINGVQLSMKANATVRIRIWTSAATDSLEAALLEMGHDIKAILKTNRKVEFKINALELAGKNAVMLCI